MDRHCTLRVSTELCGRVGLTISRWRRARLVAPDDPGVNRVLAAAAQALPAGQPAEPGAAWSSSARSPRAIPTRAS